VFLLLPWTLEIMDNRDTITVNIKRLPHGEGLPLPAYMTESAAGMDIFAAVSQDVVLGPGERMVVPSGFALELPAGYEAQVRPRSGLALKAGVTVLNSPGTIDADYRGEVGVILVNLGRDPFVIRRGERIAQLVVGRVLRVNWELKGQLGDTQRGEGGYGHTR